MPSNKGLFNESQIVMAIANKKVKDIPQNLKYVLFKIFGPLEEEEIVHSEQVKGMIKPDIYIEYKGVKKYISIKCGRATEVHAEYIDKFVEFLREYGLSDESCTFIKEYCYADGTTNGTGEDVMDFLTLKTFFKKRSEEFNKEVMSKPYLIEKVILRCLFEGNRPDKEEADYIYFGTPQFGVLCSKKQILKHLTRRTWSFMGNPHIGPLQFRMHIRGKARYEENEYKRHTIDLWWANLQADLDYISERYNID